ncbi:GNAT family N-acetyltransferase [Pseudoxanthomonas sp. SE1]|uniref:GNAT family N-acetyltransferase n=1 Tax=Pseudoxanthomonas sp. SE1 TaxID=1664560 RepID=UPI00240D6BA4|nr:GNAT family N-acetyltransferase [Pseudoxanthomonas sp. SE1]WFC41550.1 GNAT family N-acetyltransferase [Pseudoxanthomonas sp. SE1]
MNDTTLPDASKESDVWYETLRDGHRVLVRHIRPQDREAEREFIECLSNQAKHYRFLGGVLHPSENLLSQLTVLDRSREAALVAIEAGRGDGCMLGVARYSAGAGSLRCECAVTVADAWQHKGLGTVLMQRLIEVARANGMKTIYSMDLADNASMHDLVRGLGFDTRPDPDDASQVIHELRL